MVDPRLMEILCCPADRGGEPCHGDLVEHSEGLLCQACGLLYPIVDGIPVMLVEEARKID
ncbi:MAG: Trm112 family protein [Holophaga sp.]|nr:Trm112 family protein [Holophaga sp.]